MEIKSNRIALFAGSFDPFTRGHADVVARSLFLFDELIIAIGINEQKRALFSPEQRQRQIAHFYQKEPRIRVITYEDLTYSLAQREHVVALIRGVRSVQDFEYERTLADLNRQLSGVETVFLFTSQELSHISSSVVRELLHYGQDITSFLPLDFSLDV